MVKSLDMKKILVLLLIFPLIFSCKKEEEEPEPDVAMNYAPSVGAGKIALHHDDYNTDAPIMEPGTYEMAARFSATDITSASNGELVAIQYYTELKPHQAELRIYSGGFNAPESVVYTADLIPDMNTNSWNTHEMLDSIPMEAPIWIGIWFQVLGEAKYIGCDPGPANENGDWMFSEADGDWERFETRTGTSINWNIRGVILPE